MLNLIWSGLWDCFNGFKQIEKPWTKGVGIIQSILLKFTLLWFTNLSENIYQSCRGYFQMSPYLTCLLMTYSVSLQPLGIDLGIDHRWLVALQRKNQIFSLPDGRTPHHLWNSFVKKRKPESDQLFRSYYQFTGNTEAENKWYQEDTISKIQTLGSLQDKQSSFFTDWKKRDRGGTYRIKEI